MKTKVESVDKGLAAVKTVFAALEPLDDALRDFVLTSVGTLLGKPINESAGINTVLPTPQQPALNPATAAAPAQATPPANQNGQSPKLFMKSKQPILDVHRVACLAYYLTHYRSQPHFKTLDLNKLNTEAGGRRFSNAAAAVKNAENQNGYLSLAGGGKKQITAHGEDLVEALPDPDKVKVLGKSHGRPRRKKNKSKKAAAK